MTTAISSPASVPESTRSFYLRGPGSTPGRGADRGYFGIGIEAAKTPENVGGLWRSAHAFGASFIFTIGCRYPTGMGRKQATDTSKAWRHIPLYEYATTDDFLSLVPRDCELIGIECDQGRPRPLTDFKHPERAIYVLGSEDRGLSLQMLATVTRLVEIPTAYCLNVATSGAIVMYDRSAKTHPLNGERP